MSVVVFLQITALRNLDNVVHTGGEGIQSVLSSFYADRFSKEETGLAFKRPFCLKHLIESLLTGLARFPLQSALLLFRVWRRERSRVLTDYRWNFT